MNQRISKKLSKEIKTSVTDIKEIPIFCHYAERHTVQSKI